MTSPLKKCLGRLDSLGQRLRSVQVEMGESRAQLEAITDVSLALTALEQARDTLAAQIRDEIAAALARRQKRTKP